MKLLVSEDVAKMSKVVESTMECDNTSDDQEIPLPTIKTNVLSKVIEYCEHYKNVEPMTPIQTPFKSELLSELVQQWVSLQTITLLHALILMNEYNLNPSRLWPVNNDPCSWISYYFS